MTDEPEMSNDGTKISADSAPKASLGRDEAAELPPAPPAVASRSASTAHAFERTATRRSPSEDATEAGDHTLVVPHAQTDASATKMAAPVQPPCIRIEHVLPADHVGTLRIDKAVATVGRSLKSDVRLYSASASREHARIDQRTEGWYLVPSEGRAVVVDGITADDELQLRPGMRIRLGDDEIVVVDLDKPRPHPSQDCWSVPLPVGFVAAGLVVIVVLLRLLGIL